MLMLEAKVVKRSEIPEAISSTHFVLGKLTVNILCCCLQLILFLRFKRFQTILRVVGVKKNCLVEPALAAK